MTISIAINGVKATASQALDMIGTIAVVVIWSMVITALMSGNLASFVLLLILLSLLSTSR